MLWDFAKKLRPEQRGTSLAYFEAIVRLHLRYVIHILKKRSIADSHGRHLQDHLSVEKHAMYAAAIHKLLESRVSKDKSFADDLPLMTLIRHMLQHETGLDQGSLSLSNLSEVRLRFIRKLAQDVVVLRKRSGISVLPSVARKIGFILRTIRALLELGTDGEDGDGMPS